MAKLNVIGVKHFSGEIDGQKIQSLKINAVLPMEENDNQSGNAGVEYRAKYELWSVIKPYLGKFPVDLDVEITPTAGSGNRIILQVTSIKPLSTMAPGSAPR